MQSISGYSFTVNAVISALLDRRNFTKVRCWFMQAMCKRERSGSVFEPWLILTPSLERNLTNSSFWSKAPTQSNKSPTGWNKNNSNSNLSFQVESKDKDKDLFINLLPLWDVKLPVKPIDLFHKISCNFCHVSLCSTLGKLPMSMCAGYVTSCGWSSKSVCRGENFPL